MIADDVDAVRGQLFEAMRLGLPNIASLPMATAAEDARAGENASGTAAVRRRPVRVSDVGL